MIVSFLHLIFNKWEKLEFYMMYFILLFLCPCPVNIF